MCRVFGLVPCQNICIYFSNSIDLSQLKQTA
jgi:hypothetical protein